MSKLPAFQFYPADWRKDPGVQSLGYFERGVWFEILCLMHESQQRGKLLLNGRPMPDEALARLLGLDKQLLTKTLTTLLDYGVASRDEQGALISRRMVKDEELRQIRTEAGKKGGNPNLVNQNSTKPKKQVNQNSTPSFSSSFTTSEEEIHTDAYAQFPIKQLYEAFPDLRLESGQIGLILAEVAPGDEKPWLATVQIYKANYNPMLNRYMPDKVGNVLSVFRSEKAKAEKQNGSNQKQFTGPKRSDAEVFQQSADFYNDPANFAN
jgi:hypothetical protein